MWDRSMRWTATLRSGRVAVDVSVWRMMPVGPQYHWSTSSFARASGNGMRETTGHARSLTEAKRKALQTAAELLTHGETALGGGL